MVAVLATLAAAAAPAQTSPDSAPERAAPFHSALEGYQPYAAQEVAPWRESNDTVGRIGGWRAYAREAADSTPAPQAGASAPANPPSPNTAPAAPRSGHGHH